MVIKCFKLSIIWPHEEFKIKWLFALSFVAHAAILESYTLDVYTVVKIDTNRNKSFDNTIKSYIF